MSTDNLTEEQRQAVQRQGHLVRECLRKISEYKFTVGEFLIKKINTYNSEIGKHVWTTEKFSRSRNVPRKYKVVSLDEFGIPFLRKVLYNGQLHQDLIYLGNQDCAYTYYEVDPDMQYHVILGEEEKTFDPQSTYRQERYGDKHGKT